MLLSRRLGHRRVATCQDDAPLLCLDAGATQRHAGTRSLFLEAQVGAPLAPTLVSRNATLGRPSGGFLLADESSRAGRPLPRASGSPVAYVLAMGRVCCQVAAESGGVGAECAASDQGVIVRAGCG